MLPAVPTAAGSAGALPVGSPAPVPVPGVLQMIRTPRMLLPASSRARRGQSNRLGWSQLVSVSDTQTPASGRSFGFINTAGAWDAPGTQTGSFRAPSPTATSRHIAPKGGQRGALRHHGPQGWDPQPGWSTNRVHPPPRAPRGTPARAPLGELALARTVHRRENLWSLQTRAFGAVPSTPATAPLFAQLRPCCLNPHARPGPPPAPFRPGTAFGHALPPPSRPSSEDGSIRGSAEGLGAASSLTSSALCLSRAPSLPAPSPARGTLRGGSALGAG